MEFVVAVKYGETSIVGLVAGIQKPNAEVGIHPHMQLHLVAMTSFSRFIRTFNLSSNHPGLLDLARSTHIAATKRG